MRGELENHPDVSFIGGLMFGELLDEMTGNYEKKYRELTGKEFHLAAASPERLLLYSCALVLYQGMQYIDRAGKNGLLKYSTGEFLDHLAALKRVWRNPEKAASTILEFSLSKEQAFPVYIPAGTRVRGNSLFFATDREAAIPAGENGACVPAVCLTPGTAGNGFRIGEISTLVDPINYIKSVRNTVETHGGAEQESDDELAARVFLAPSGYSTAGAEDAYRYWVKTWSQAVEDCYIVSEAPGEVDIYVLYKGGEIPDEGQLEALKRYLEDGNRKPCTDKVVIKAPALNEYEIDATYFIADSDRENVPAIRKQVEAACQEYIGWQRQAIGRDVNPAQLMYRMIHAGACNAIIRSPAWQEITEAVISRPGTVRLDYGGLQDGGLNDANAL